MNPRLLQPQYMGRLLKATELRSKSHQRGSGTVTLENSSYFHTKLGGCALNFFLQLRTSITRTMKTRNTSCDMHFDVILPFCYLMVWNLFIFKGDMIIFMPFVVMCYLIKIQSNDLNHSCCTEQKGSGPIRLDCTLQSRITE